VDLKYIVMGHRMSGDEHIIRQLPLDVFHHSVVLRTCWTEDAPR
jgi:hypothetical protein